MLARRSMRQYKAKTNETTMTDYPELAAFVRNKSFRKNEVTTLSSGAPTDFYVDGKATLLHPKGIPLVAKAMIEVLKDYDVDGTAGMSIGAAPIVSVVAALSGKYHGFVVRKERKPYGMQRHVEGPWKSGDRLRVAVVDDVVTTGGSLLDAAEILRTEGFVVVVAIAMVDRDQGGRAAIEARGLPYRVLVEKADLMARTPLSR